MCASQQSCPLLGIDGPSAGSSLRLEDTRPEPAVCNHDQSPRSLRWGAQVVSSLSAVLFLARSTPRGVPRRHFLVGTERGEGGQKRAADSGLWQRLPAGHIDRWKATLPLLALQRWRATWRSLAVSSQCIYFPPLDLHSSHTAQSFHPSPANSHWPSAFSPNLLNE